MGKVPGMVGGSVRDVYVPKKKKRSWRRKVVVGALALGTAFGGGYLISSHKRHRAAQELRAVEALRDALGGLKLVRSPSKWASICRIYNWEPKTPEGAARINLIESVSKRTGVSPARVLLTIETNSVDVHAVRSWQSRLRSLESQLSAAQRVYNTSKGGAEWRRARSSVKTLPGKIAQAERVIAVINTLLAEDMVLANAIARETRGVAGSKAAVERLAE